MVVLVVQPHLVIEMVEGDGLLGGIESLITQVGSHQRGVFLFDVTVIVFVVGATAR